MTYDPVDDYLLLVGGTFGSSWNYTWALVGDSWVNLTQGSNLTVVAGDALTYDAHDGYALMFGAGNPSGFVNSSWSFRAGTWTRLNTSGETPNPSIANFDSMAYDPALQSVVFFDGSSNYTYLYQSGVWRAVYAPLPSSGVYDGSMVYDSQIGEMLFFGGSTSNLYGVTYYNELWAFNGTSWVALHPTISPPATDSAALTYDLATNQVIEWGGATNNQTWIWGAGNVSFSVTPPEGGAIDVNGTSHGGGTSAWEPFGEHSIQLDPAVGYHGTNLSVGGNLTAVGGSYQLSGNATISGTFAAFPTVTLESRPWRCGVEFNGSSYSNGSSPYFAPGTFSLVAPACSGLTFGGWTLVGNGTVGSRSSNTTSVELTGSAELVATYEASFVVYVNPTGAGSVWVNGSIEPSGIQVELVAGNYTISEQAAPGWRFGGYATEPGISVSGGVLRLLTSGWIEANFTTHPEVTIETNLERCPGVEFNGTWQTNGSSTFWNAGTYEVSAPTCSDALFDRWNTTGGVSVGEPTEPTTSVVVTANGTLAADYWTAAWVTVGSTPSAAAGFVEWEAHAVGNGTAFETAVGNYTVRAEAADGWSFEGWATTGGVSAVGGSAMVASNGTLTAEFEKTVLPSSPSNGSGSTGFLGLPGLDGVAVTAVGALAVVVGVAWWIRRRRTGRPPEDDGPSD